MSETCPALRTLTPVQLLDDRTSPAAAGLKHGSRLVLVAPWRRLAERT